ncbi:ThuA-like domain-containing protein [Schizophyllum amplum]|uniref:ThuA-like domain-containing protein n=1 Tax=Schizophyllum amplum TaxID=97359 RepID=A0A550BS09_9AGAR|nr:ThuA-like domain-containing protein [Auriculariopsis ampla]
MAPTFHRSSSACSSSTASAWRPARPVLIYSATEQFRHDSIPTAVQALKGAGDTYSITFDATEDRTLFTDGNLSQYDALVFLSNTGEELFEPWREFVGIHSATDCLNTTELYGKEIERVLTDQTASIVPFRATLVDHDALRRVLRLPSEIQNATINVVDASHPSTSMLPAQWQIRDEMYNFKSDPAMLAPSFFSLRMRAVTRVSVILPLLVATYSDRMKDDGERKYDQGSPHPTAWYQEQGAGVQDGGTPGRSFYTSLGHLNETWHDETFMAHIMGGIQWALDANTTRAFNSSASVGNGDASAAETTSSSAPEASQS